jgi:hypothetical protein
MADILPGARIEHLEVKNKVPSFEMPLGFHGANGPLPGGGLYYTKSRKGTKR